MSENSKIEWTEHTFNPWHGCAKVSPGCKNCYAETLTNRWGGDYWGIHAPRKFMSDAYWQKPIKWNKQAEKAGRIDRVFCASMADVFEFHQDPEIDERMHQERMRLFQLITDTPHLMWLLLTKRPENVVPVIDRVGSDFGMILTPEEQELPENVCIMTSVENQEQANKRIPELLAIPAQCYGLSIEPLLDSVDLSPWLDDFARKHLPSPCWVIAGGESGHGARPMHPDWVRSLRDQCEEAGVPFFFKQWGAWLPWEPDAQPPFWNSQNGQFRDGHGLFPDEPVNDWPASWDPGDAFIDYGHACFQRVGKKAAGRLLDGKEYNAHPFNLKTEEVPA